MRFIALASDYDGTLARDGVVASTTVDALRRLAESGRTLILVTGRELPELRALFADLVLFDCVVAENGAMLYWPKTGTVQVLTEPPPEAFVAALRASGMPLSVGEAIVSTVHPHETLVLEAIRRFGLELQLIFNKGAVMVLPGGVNKASGLAAALAELGLSPRNTAAIGDAENDHTMFEFAEYGVAVANAVPMLKRAADWVVGKTHGEGVVDLIEALLSDDLAGVEARPARRTVTLGHRGEDVIAMSSATSRLLVSASDAEVAAAYGGRVLEELLGQGYQCCVVDASGSFAQLGGSVNFNATDAAPEIDAVVQTLERPDASVTISVAAMSEAGRREFLGTLMSRLRGLRKTRGRPHWLVVDRADNLLGDLPGAVEDAVPAGVALLMVTAHPEALAPDLLLHLDAVVAVGQDPAKTMASAARRAGVSLPRIKACEAPGDALVWISREAGGTPALQCVQVPSPARKTKRTA